MKLKLIEIKQEPQKELDELVPLTGENYYFISFDDGNSIEFQTMEEFQKEVCDMSFMSGVDRLFVEEGFLYREDGEDFKLSKSVIDGLNASCDEYYDQFLQELEAYNQEMNSVNYNFI